jgi:hypothetical protein
MTKFVIFMMTKFVRARGRIDQFEMIFIQVELETGKGGVSSGFLIDSEGAFRPSSKEFSKLAERRIGADLGCLAYTFVSGFRILVSRLVRPGAPVVGYR